ncbi:uncharacterized protein LOC114148768 [Xiphophorus couchianus]|uniref:uncharacterized protein LOC114148768 n=1 Tax=Xiphophorus couchianus TaxID=32473 RepID=UPI0010170022|nr:uncharacterized protein LOC114148768 [Xiphophorus couchianus]XP_027880059.1 uncharacterized protein LOC114148768 [Xiphophorus couchianus]
MAKQNNELLQRITTLEDIEQKEYEDMGAALENVQENVKSLHQRINQVKDFQRHHQLGMSPDLVQAEKKVISIWQRIQRIAGFHQSQHAETRSALQQERESLKFLWESSSFQNTAEATEERNNSQSTGRNQQQNQNQSKTSIISHFFSRQKTATNTETQEQKSDLKMEEEKHLQRIDMIENHQQEQHQQIRDDLNQVGKEMTELQLRIHHIETTQRFEIRMKEMAGELQATRSNLKEKEEELNFFKDRQSEMDKELQTTRSVLNKTEEELKSFKDRVALEVAPSIKTGNTMSLNSPVSKNRIREMYETLRCDWPKIKEDLKLAGEKPDSVQNMIQKQFTLSRTDMEEKNVMISNFFELNKSKHGTESPEVKEYLLLAIQNLQLAIYNQKYGNGSQKPLSAHEVTNHKDMMEYLSSECYWLGCLMALNNPPINPDWENHAESMDKWDILPRNITAASVKK